MSAVVPNRVPAGTTPVVRVEGRDLVPTWNAMGDRVRDVVVEFGGRAAVVEAYGADGTTLEARIPEGLAQALHDVRVRTAAGEDVLERGLAVTPP